MSHGSVRVLGVLPMAVASFGVPFGVLGRMLLESECVRVCVCACLLTACGHGRVLHAHQQRGKKKRKKELGGHAYLARQLADSQHATRSTCRGFVDTHEGGLPAQQPIRARIGAGWLLFPWARGRGEQPSWRVLQAAQAYPL